MYKSYPDISVSDIPLLSYPSHQNKVSRPSLPTMSPRKASCCWKIQLTDMQQFYEGYKLVTKQHHL